MSSRRHAHRRAHKPGLLADSPGHFGGLVMPKRVDSNQPEIVDALRRANCQVQDLHAVGSGCPDLLVGFRGVNYLLEIKSQYGRVTRREHEWHRDWRGQVAVVKTPAEALRAVGACYEL